MTGKISADTDLLVFPTVEDRISLHLFLIQPNPGALLLSF